MNIYKLHEYLLEFQKDGYFIEDKLELYFLGVVTKEEKQKYCKSFEEIIHSCLFEIKQELFQLLDGIPKNEYKNNLMFFISIILEMRIEKFTFEKMKQERGKNWKTREKPKEKINWREYPSLDGMKPLETPDEIRDTSCEIYVQEFEYKKKLPLGYETEWYGEIKKEFIDIVFETRQEYKLPKNEKIILDSISKIYNKL